MQKHVICGLLVIAAFSNTAMAASTSLLTAGTVQVATGTLSSLLGNPVLYTWDYDTDLNTATQYVTDAPLASGGSYNAYTSGDYKISSSPFDTLNGFSFAIALFDNGIATDYKGSTSLASAMTSNGLEPNNTLDSVAFYLQFSSDFDIGYVELIGTMFFEDDFFSAVTPILPPAETLLANVLFTYGSVTDYVKVYDENGENVISVDAVGFARFAEVPVSAVPIPASVFLLAPAILAFLGFRRKLNGQLS